MPTLTPPESNIDHWYKLAEEKIFSKEMHPIVRTSCGSMPAAFSDFYQYQDDKMNHNRIYFVKGTRMDVQIRHTSPQPSQEPSFSDTLSVISKSLYIPANNYIPTLDNEETVYNYLDQARDAQLKGEWSKVVDSAAAALKEARSAYIASLVNARPIPEIPAVIAVIDSLIFMASAAPNMLILRNAERLSSRALYTVLHLPLLPSMRRQQSKDALQNRLNYIMDMQTKIVEGDSKAAMMRPGLHASFIRRELLRSHALRYLQLNDYEMADAYCNAAIDDGLITVGLLDKFIPSAPQNYNLDAVEKPTRSNLNAENIDTKKLAMKLFCLDELHNALNLLVFLQDEKGDIVSTIESTDLLTRVSRLSLQIHNEANSDNILSSRRIPAGARDAIIAQQQHYSRQIVISLIQHAMVIAKIEDEPNLRNAERFLEEAEVILDALGEDGLMRAWLCITRASILHSSRTLEGSIEVIDRGLHACSNQPNETEKLRRELLTIKSQFLLNMGRFEQAEETAIKAIEIASNPSTDEQFVHGKYGSEQSAMSNYYLNLSIVQIRLNKHEQAAKNLREALQYSLKHDPFSETTLRVLVTASRLYSGKHNLALSYILNLAAASTLDASRTKLDSDIFRIGFDEATRRRETYEDLVGHLINLGGYEKEAVAAADRARAQSLNELLFLNLNTDNENDSQNQKSLRGEQIQESLTTKIAPSLLDETDIEKGLWRGAQYVISEADKLLKKHGAAKPISPDEISELARNTGAQILVIQPIRNKIALFFISCSGHVEFRPVQEPLEEVLEQIDVASQQLQIFSVLRGGTKNKADYDLRESTYDSLDATSLDQVLSKLWEYLIGPVYCLFAKDVPLIIVPYREFALIPYAALIDKDGRPLSESYVLSIVPSLATLKSIRERQPWTRIKPNKAYIIGDPEISDKYQASGLSRLPKAKAEAENVVSILENTAGVEEEKVILRTDKGAHTESYRKEAYGCDLIHLSCHAKLKEPAYTSCMYLAPYSNHDGMLLASEISEVKINDALVFLAACETGQGRATADGIIGFGRALLQAGARAVILSLWSIDDTATFVLVNHFYHALLGSSNSQSAASSLREAMMRTLQDLRAGNIIPEGGTPLDTHPANWASFILLGDGLSIIYRNTTTS
jgi:CHAT domain-containing protein